MRNKTSVGRVALAAVVTVFAAMAASTGIASATPVSWSVSGTQAQVTGSLTLTKGADVAYCNNIAFTIITGTGGSWTKPVQEVSCVRNGIPGKLGLRYQYGTADRTAGVTTLNAPGFGGFYILASPWGGYSQLGLSVQYLNGSGGTPSKMVFNNTPIGYVGSNFYATGTLNVNPFQLPGQPAPPPLTLN